jgi:hypothetical protein
MGIAMLCLVNRIYLEYIRRMLFFCLYFPLYDLLFASEGRESLFVHKLSVYITAKNHKTD